MTTIEDWGDLIVPRGAGDGTWWPAGRFSVPTGNLKSIMALSGRHHARRAIRLYVSFDRDELLDAASSIGTAVELTAKAFLASVSTSLLALKGDRDSILLLTGNASLTTRTPVQLRSVSASEALDHARRIDSRLPWREVDPALEVRNAALHMGIVQQTGLRPAIIQMCKLLEVLVPAMGLDFERYWGDEWHAVESVLDDARTELAATVAAKRAAAVVHFNSLMESLGKSSIDMLLATTTPKPVRYADHDDEVTCPVCGALAWLGCIIRRGELEFERDEYGNMDHVWVDLDAVPVAFYCALCRLDLEDEELDEFDLPRSIELEPDFEPEEALSHWDQG